MTMAIGDPDFARSGGVAKAAAQIMAQRAMVEGFLEAWGGWPPLDSVENAQRRLDMLSRLSGETYLDGARAGAAVRAVEQWLKAEDLRKMQLRIAQLEAQVAALKTAAKRGR